MRAAYRYGNSKWKKKQLPASSKRKILNENLILHLNAEQM